MPVKALLEKMRTGPSNFPWDVTFFLAQHESRYPTDWQNLRNVISYKNEIRNDY